MRSWGDFERFGGDSDRILILFQDIKKSKQSNKNTENTLLTHIKIISKSKLQSQAANKSEQPIIYESYQSMNSMKVTILDTLHPRACWCHNPCRVAVLRWVFQSERTGRPSQCTASSKKNCVVVPTWNSLRVWWDLAQLHRTAWIRMDPHGAYGAFHLLRASNRFFFHALMWCLNILQAICSSQTNRENTLQNPSWFEKRAWPRGHFCIAWLIRPLLWFLLYIQYQIK